MQLDDLETETTELINRLKHDFEKFKSSISKLMQRIETQFLEIIFEISISKQFLQNLYNNQELLQNADYFHILVQEMNKITFTQQTQFIFNKLSNRIKYWESHTKNLLNIKMDKILQINEMVNFNEQFKQDSIKLLKDKMIKQCFTRIYYCFALFDQPVNCKKIQHFLFKVHGMIKYVGIGLANTQIIETNQYKNRLENDDHGAYLCFADQGIMHHADPTKNKQKIGIKMEVGDIIELTFNPFEKSIKWENLNNNQQYSTVIDNIDQELRGCVVMKHKDTKVQISDDELMLE